MSFLAFSPQTAYALLGAVAVLIWLLYLIRPRKARLPVASTLLWRRVLGTERVRRDRWRWVLSLLLALAIGLSLALALTRPEWRTLGIAHQRIVVILDNSASMAARTRDGRTRWQHALDSARSVLQRAPAGSEALVLDTAGRASLAGFVAIGQAVEKLAQVPLSPEARGHIPALAVGAAITAVHLFTDGVGIDAVVPGVILHSVFEPAENVAITSFEARAVPGAPTRYEAFMQLVNAGPAPKAIALEVVGADGFRLERELQVAGASTVNQVFDVSRFEQGILSARVRAEGDAFDLDDRAYCVVAPHRERHVLLVTSGNEFLEDSLRALPGVALTVRRPSEVTQLPAFDAYVFDRFAPQEAPASGALLFRPPAVGWIGAKWRPASQPEVETWDQTDPLTAGVAWRDLRFESAQLAETATPRALVTATAGSGATGALVLSGRARARWVAVGFALQDSNFPLQSGLPVFLGTVLSHLTESARVITEGVGRIEVPIAGAQIIDSGNHRIASATTARGTLFEAARPDVYVAANGPQRLIVVANVIDPRIGQINYSTIGPPDQRDPRSSPRARWPEPWVLLLGLAFALLAVEWSTFSRRATV